MPSPLVAALAVALGAAIGALLRWGLGSALNALYPAVPPGTWVANVVGGYLVGVAVAVFAMQPDASPLWRLFVVTGFLGGLTTFSAFSAEVIALLQAGRPGLAALAVTGHVAGSLLATLAGIASVRAWPAAQG